MAHPTSRVDPRTFVKGVHGVRYQVKALFAFGVVVEERIRRRSLAPEWR